MRILGSQEATEMNQLLPHRQQGSFSTKMKKKKTACENEDSTIQAKSIFKRVTSGQLDQSLLQPRRFVTQPSNALPSK